MSALPRKRTSFRSFPSPTLCERGCSVGPVPVPSEYLLAHPFRVTFPIADDLNDQLGEHGHNRVIAVYQLEVAQKPVKRGSHNGDVFRVECAPVFFFDEPPKCSLWQAAPPATTLVPLLHDQPPTLLVAEIKLRHGFGLVIIPSWVRPIGK
jgi:hypothetical protein